MRWRVDLRDLALVSLLWLVLFVIADNALWVPQRIFIIWITGGVLAGLLLVVQPRRWWLVIVPYAIAVAVSLAIVPLPWSVMLVGAVGESAAAVVYAVVLRRHASADTGLGAPVGWVLAGTAAGVLVRMSAVTLAAVVDPGLGRDRLLVYWPVFALAAATGLLIGSSLVLGIAHWRDLSVGPASRRVEALVAVVTLLLLVIAYVLPIEWLAHGHGYFGIAEFLVLPLLLYAAARCSPTFSSTLTAIAVLMIGSAAARRAGVHEGQPVPELEQILLVQVFLLALILSRAVISAALAERQRAADRAQQAATRASAAAANLQRIFDRSPVPTVSADVTADDQLRVREVNDAFSARFGEDAARPGSLLGAGLGLDGPIEVPDLEGEPLRATAPDGSPRVLTGTVSVLVPDGSETASAVVALEDVTAAEAFEELRRFQASRDPLCGLLNRESLLATSEDPAADEQRRSLAIVLVDLNGTALLNRSFGFAVGDRALIKVAERLQKLLLPGDRLARAGGDSFVFIRPNLTSPEQAEDLARLLLEQVRQPMDLAGQVWVLTASAGCAYSRDSEATEGSLFLAAEEALEAAKASGRDRVARRDVDQDATANRLERETKLRKAFDDDRIVCLYQPVIDIDAGRIVGAEALVRVLDTDGSLLGPAAFLPLAEELGLVPRLTEIVLEQACRTAARWRAAGHDLHVAVNVQPNWLSPASAELVLATLERYALETGHLVLEVTEDQAAEVSGSHLEAMDLLVQAGVAIAIDDFGTGYAGLTAFRALPSRLLKIDRSFVTGMLQSHEGHYLVQTMISLAHGLDKRVIAEGVETPEQYAALQELGCDFVQGYLTGRPMPAADVPQHRPLP